MASARCASKRSAVRKSARACDWPILRHDELRDHRRGDAQPRLGEAEARSLRRDGDVADGGESRAAAERRAVDAPDDGMAAGVDGAQHVGQFERVGDVLVVGEVETGAHPVQVGARAEALARALQHDRADVLGLAQPLEGALNLADEPLIEGIVQFRAVQRDDGGESLAGEAQMLVDVLVPGLARRIWLAHH